MSRIGNAPITLPEKVEVAITPAEISVKGPLGTMSQKLHPEVKVENAPMVFVGYGVTAPERNWDDFKGVDLKGKVALVLVNDPDFEAAAGEPVGAVALDDPARQFRGGLGELAVLRPGRELLALARLFVLAQARQLVGPVVVPRADQGPHAPLEGLPLQRLEQRQPRRRRRLVQAVEEHREHWVRRLDRLLKRPPGQRREYAEWIEKFTPV